MIKYRPNSRHKACYRANKPSNLVITSKSYKEKTKKLMHKNKTMKASKTSIKGVGDKI